MQKNAGDIEERLRMIENVRLFKQPPSQPACDLMEAKVRNMHVHIVVSAVLHDSKVKAL